MAETVDRRVIEIDIKTARDMHAELQRVNQSMRDMEERFSQVGRLARNFGGAIGGFFSVRNLVQGFKSVVDELDSIGDAAQRLGTSTKFIQEMSYAAKLAGEDLSTVERATNRFAKSLADATEEGKSAQRAMTQLGVNVDGLRAGTANFEDEFTKVMTGIANAPDSFQKLALATQVFGREGGAAMVDIATKTERARKEVEQLQIIMGPDAIARAGQLKEEIASLSAQFDALGTVIAVKLLPGALKVAEWTQQAIRDYGVLPGLLAGVTLAYGELWKAILFGATEAPMQQAITRQKEMITETEMHIKRLRDMQDRAGGLAPQAQANLTKLEMSLKLLNQQLAALEQRAKGAAEGVKPPQEVIEGPMLPTGTTQAEAIREAERQAKERERQRKERDKQAAEDQKKVYAGWVESLNQVQQAQHDLGMAQDQGMSGHEAQIKALEAENKAVQAMAPTWVQMVDQQIAF